MTEHTERILHRMVKIINQYKNGEVTLPYLVNSLEGSISAIEEPLSEAFKEIWYKHWGNLEIVLALNEEEGKRNDILADLDGLEVLIKQTINKTNTHF